MNNFNLRRVSSIDYKKYREIRLEALSGNDARAFGGSKNKLKGKTDDELKKRLDSEERFYYALEENNKFISIGGAKKIADDMWMIVAVYTLEEERGKGYSKTILKAVESELKEKGIKKITLMVNAQQEPAIKLYKNLGFVIVDRAKNQLMGDGNFYDEYVMEKNLL